VLVLLSGFLVCAQCACARAAGPIGKGRSGRATVDGSKSADPERADLSARPADSREPVRSVRLPAEAHLASHMAQAPSRVQPVHRLAATRGHDRRPRTTPSVDPNGTATPQVTGVRSSASVGTSEVGSRVAVQAVLLALLLILAAPCSSKLAGGAFMARPVALVSAIDRPG
jgi:hypothetical protein